MSADRHHSDSNPLAPAGLMVAARIANMAVGLLMIPVLLHFLGGMGFAAWAILLAAGAVFSTLETGTAPTLIKHIAVPVQNGDWNKAHVIQSHVLLILLLAHAAGAPIVIWFSDSLARGLQLPDGRLLTAGGMIIFVYFAATARALLQNGANTLYAALRFRAFALVSFAQPFASNCAAAIAAVITGCLDVTLICFWLAQLLVLGVTFLFANRMFIRQIVPASISFSTLRELASHGLKIQVGEWAQLVNFQVDKFLIAALVGLWGVAPYEVANRSVLALRSVPSTGLGTFLPTAVLKQDSGAEVWTRYRAMTRLAAMAVMVFMLAPLAVAPIFLYAWTGEMGYVGRWVFVALMLGAVCNVLALPAAAMAQAAGRAEIQAKSALVSMLVNIPLSLLLVSLWGLEGAALGTALAMLVSSALLISDVHRAYGQALDATLKMLGSFWPLLVVCALVGTAVSISFELWLATVDAAVRYSRQMRIVPGLLAGMAYAICVIAMLFVQLRRGALLGYEADFLSRLIRLRWFTLYCQSKLARG